MAAVSPVSHTPRLINPRVAISSLPVALAVLGEWQALDPGLCQLRYKGEGLGAKLECPELGEKSQEIQITQVDPAFCSFKVEGRCRLKEAMCPGDIAINGGFYTASDWYRGGVSQHDGYPIGVFKSRTFDSTDRFSLDEASTQYWRRFLSSEASDGTLTPTLYRDCYGVLLFEKNRITLMPQEEVERERLASVDFCQAAAPILISKGEVVFLKSRLEEERFQWQEIEAKAGLEPGACPPGSLYHADQPNPRSAIGIDSEGKVYFVTVLGREENREGLTLPSMALLMKKIGCVEALNLDGGYSAYQIRRESEEEWDSFNAVSPFPKFPGLIESTFIVASPLSKAASFS